MDAGFDRSRQLPEPLWARLWHALEQMRGLLEPTETCGQAMVAKAIKTRHRLRLEKAVRDLLALERPMSQPLRHKSYYHIDVILRTFMLAGDDVLADIGSAAAEIKVVLTEAMAAWGDPPDAWASAAAKNDLAMAALGDPDDVWASTAAKNDLAARAVMQWIFSRSRDASPPKRLILRRGLARGAAADVVKAQRGGSPDADSDSLASGPILAQI